jgi:hypothetical protein
MPTANLSAAAVSDKALAGVNETVVRQAKLIAIDRLLASERNSRGLSTKVLSRLRSDRGKLLTSAPPAPGKAATPGDFVRLSQRASGALPQANLAAPSFIRGQLTGFGLGYEGRVRLPPCADGISVEPHVAGASGSIDTSELFDWGGIDYGAITQDDAGSNPAGLVWLRNWKQIALLPPPPTASTVDYRLDLSLETFLFPESVDYGVHMVFASVGHAPRYEPGKDIPVNQNTGWLLIQDVGDPPFNGNRYGLAYGGLTVTGRMHVAALTVSAVALVYGAVIILRSGRFRIIYGLISPSAAAHPDPLTPEEVREAYGKIHYRITPELVLSPG